MRLRLRNEALIVLSFVGLILLGTALLLLPQATSEGRISPIDALFTATSAVCVTGLIVVDTGTYFSVFGQVLVLALIQLGGLGIITISSFFAILLGKRMPLKQREIVRQTHSSLDPRSFRQLVTRIVLFSFAIEMAGALLLWVSWWKDYGFWDGLWKALFHAVSAFCNAGFSLFSDNLIRYQTNWAVNLVVVVLIFLGGIGFLVIYDVERALLTRQRLSLHSQLALGMSALLIVGGTVLFVVAEYHNVMEYLSFPQKVLTALFMAVTARTAGFNTVDYGQLTNASLVLTMTLMFVGGSPGSTAGGIKTTTFAILLAMGYSRSRGQTATSVFRRTVPEKVINEMFSIIMLSLAVLILVNFTLQISETGFQTHREAAGRYIELSFESVSAFGTVGLSTGVTPSLTTSGKFQLILLMLVGRTGPLVIAVAMARRHREALEYEYYRENVMVG